MVGVFSRATAVSFVATGFVLFFFVVARAAVDVPLTLVSDDLADFFGVAFLAFAPPARVCFGRVVFFAAALEAVLAAGFATDRLVAFFAATFFTDFFTAFLPTAFFAGAAFLADFFTAAFLVTTFLAGLVFTLFFALPVRPPEAPVRLPADLAVFLVVFFFGLNVIAWSN